MTSQVFDKIRTLRVVRPKLIGWFKQILENEKETRFHENVDFNNIIDTTT